MRYLAELGRRYTRVCEDLPDQVACLVIVCFVGPLLIIFGVPISVIYDTTWYRDRTPAINRGNTRPSPSFYVT